MTGIWASSCAAQNASSTSPGRGRASSACSATRRQAKSNAHRPIRGDERGPPGAPDGGEDPVALGDEPRGQALERRTAPPEPVARALDGPPDPAQRAVRGDAASRPRANSTANTPRPMSVASSRSGSTPPRRIAVSASSGSASTIGQREQAGGRQPRGRLSRRSARGDEHAVLQRRAHRAAARRELGERVARELRGDHGPARRSRGARFAATTRCTRGAAPAGPPSCSQRSRRELADLPPGSEHVEHRAAPPGRARRR